ncbi:MAG: class I adenylate-forming enzyme family protein [Rhodospirillaceae bacterium]|nr:class I adenylate-forming enzyme family protein [Rhodospirillaceae bacterium]
MQTSSPAKIAEYTAKGWWSDQTFTQLFDSTTAAVPTRLAILDAPNRPDIAFGAARRLTYAEASACAQRIAAALHAAGVRQGDSVLVQLPNIAELLLTYIAVARLGAIISPVPMQYGRHELGTINKVLRPRALVSLTKFKTEDVAAQLHEAFPELPVLAFGPPSHRGVQRLDDTASDAASEAAVTGYISGLKISGNDIYTICWTSGTTGKPKGVPRSHNHWFCQSYAVHDAVHLKDGDILLNPFPFVNMAAISGFLFVWLFARGTLALHHPLDLTVMLKQIQDEGVVYTIVPPAALNMLLRQKELLAAFDLSKLRTICSGSAPLSPVMVKGFKDLLNIDVVNTFGSNEGVSLVSCGEDVPDPEHRALYFPRFGVDGLTWRNRIAQQIKTKLVDPVTHELVTERGRAGELWIKGPNVFDGYLHSPVDNTDVFDGEGYFRSGDLFEIVGDDDPPRFYRFVGRHKDLIIRGGMNISPDEIDHLLAHHPKVVETAVFGVPDEILGERVCLAAVPKPGVTLTLDDFKDFLHEKGVAIFKWPERLMVVDALPRNPLGKVLRTELRASSQARG